MLKFIFVLIVSILPFLSAPASAETRVALVVGNSAYSKVAALSNPARDAAAMTELFGKAGYNVMARNDLTIDEMRKAMREFSEAAAGADIAVIYYAGHGIELDGVNYLLPIDAKLARDIDVEDEAMSMDRFMRAIEPAKKLRLVILDACRDNPFAPNMKRTVASRSIGRGLAKVEPAASDTLIAYAAKAGSTAADGDGGNSPFTRALVNHITVPGLDLRIALGRVRDDVLNSTSRKQEPFVYGSLGGSIVSLVSLTDADRDPAPHAAPADPSQSMRRDYELASQVGTQQAWESFLEAFPTGFYANLAKSQLAKIIAANKAAGEAAEAKAKADAAAAANVGADDAGKKEAEANAKRAKAEADAKAKAAAAAEKARSREAEVAKRRAQTRERKDRADDVALPPRQAAMPRSRGGMQVFDREPPPYSVGVGRKVLINDGSCPAGQITEMTGGNPRMQQKRQFRCVAR